MNSQRALSSQAGPRTLRRAHHRALPSLCRSSQDSPSTSGSARRGVLVLPGLGNNAADYAALSILLAGQGYSVKTVAISRLDWSRNAAALTDAAWWRGQLKPRPAVDWYLTRIDQAMKELRSELGDNAPVTMLTHSAGGWLGRVYLNDWGTQTVDRYVSLGSPHMPPPPGVIDQTRGILTWINDTCPGAFHKEVTYTTVASRFIKGVDPISGNGSPLEKFAGAGYQQVCGDPEVWGDFIVPVPAAHLPGATNLDLDGVFHSPLGGQLPTFESWYGSEGVLPQWQWALDGSAPQAGSSSTQLQEMRVQQ